MFVGDNSFTFVKHSKKFLVYLEGTMDIPPRKDEGSYTYILKSGSD
jgi:hypothetical protein